MSAIGKALLSLFYPDTCPLCGKYGKGICAECDKTLPRTEQAEIRQNGTEMVLTDLGVRHLQRAAAYLYYDKDHPIRQLIHRIKYSDKPTIGYELGKQAAMEMQYADFFDEIDVIIPIPLHPRRLRERGYNQSEYIAKGISEVTGIPVDTTHVIRTRNTPKQALQTGEERQHNVADAFEVIRPEQLYRKHILILDDLITTGETIRSCTKAMRRIRKAQFTVFALCKAR